MFKAYDGYGIFTLIWCTLCMIIGFVVTGFTIYEFDHPSLLLIRSDSHHQTLTIRILTYLSLLFYCIALICYTIAAYDKVINGDQNTDYKHDIYRYARTGMFICYVIAYLSMVFVLIERLKQMTMYINKQYGNMVYGTLIMLIMLSIAAFSMFYVIHHDPDHGLFGDIQNRVLVLFFGSLGFFVHLSFTFMMIYLFCNRLYQHLWLQQRNLIVSSSTDHYKDQHQHKVMLNLILRYTSLSILAIFSTFVVMIPVLLYFSNIQMYDGDKFFEYFAWWILGVDVIINVVCILFYLPLSIRSYHKVCCGLELLCNGFILVFMKKHIVHKIHKEHSCSVSASMTL